MICVRRVLFLIILGSIGLVSSLPAWANVLIYRFSGDYWGITTYLIQFTGCIGNPSYYTGPGFVSVAQSCAQDIVNANGFISEGAVEIWDGINRVDAGWQYRTEAGGAIKTIAGQAWKQSQTCADGWEPNRETGICEEIQLCEAGLYWPTSIKQLSETGPISAPNTIVVDGCEYANPAIAFGGGSPPCFARTDSGSGTESFYCTYGYTSTGNAATPSEGQPDQTANNGAPQPGDSTDTRKSDLTTTLDGPNVTQNPDGSETTEESKTTTKNEGVGFCCIAVTGGGVKATKEGGVSTETVDSKTVNLRPDGSATVDESKTITTTDNGQKNITVSPTGDISVVEEPPGEPQVAQTQKTTEYPPGSGGPATGSPTSINTTASGGGGSGAGDPGSDSGHGLNDGSGSGSGDGTGDGSGSVPSLPPGDLYQPTDKTYSSVLTAFKDRVNSAGFYSSVTSFFETSVSGSCPSWELPATALTPSIPIDMQCSAAMDSIWPLIQAIIIATAGFIAFRWAFL